MVTPFGRWCVAIVGRGGHPGHSFRPLPCLATALRSRHFRQIGAVAPRIIRRQNPPKKMIFIGLASGPIAVSLGVLRSSFELSVTLSEPAP